MPRPRETLAQAAARMQREGFSQKQIQGQVHRWHPDWGSQRIKTATAPPKGGARQPVPKATVPRSQRANLFAPSSPTLTPKSSTERMTPASAALDRTNAIRVAHGLSPIQAPSSGLPKDYGASGVAVRGQDVVHHRAVEPLWGGAIGKHIVGVAESALPMVKGQFAWTKPEILKRTSALKDTAALGIIGGTEWAGKSLWHKIQHDHRRAQYIQAVIHQEAKTGRQLTPREQNHLAAGFGVDPNETGPLKVQHFKNLAAGLAGIATGTYHDPIGVAKDIGKLAVSIPVGTGLLVAAMSRPDLSPEDRKKMLAAMPQGIKDEYVKHFGSGLSAEQAFKRAEEDPVNTTLLYPLPVGAAAQTARVAWLLKSGKGLKEAVRLARDPEVQRMLTYTERGTEGADAVKTQIPTFWSSSVLWRNAAQRPYDLISRGIEAVPGARALPIAEGKRALRAQAKAVRRTKTRRTAEAHAAFREVQAFINHRNALGQKVNEHYATTIAALVQKPDGFTDNEWEQAIIQNLKDMRADPENVTLPGDEISPAEQRIINRINRYDKRAEAERVRKKGLSVRRLANEQRRLGENLDRIVGQMHDMHQKYIDIQDSELMPKARADLTTRYDAEMKALRSEADVMRQKLHEISVDQPPIESATRTQLRDTLERIPYFQDNPQAIEDVFLAGDAVAHHWAKTKGRDPAEWWDKRHVAGLVSGEEIPLEAFAQARPEGEPLVPFSLSRGPTPEQLAENLRYLPGGDLHKPHLGHQRNKKAYRTVNGQRVQVFGKITPEEWVKRIVAVVPDAAERDTLARWYRNAGPQLYGFFGRDAEQILRGFTASQANMGPAGGITAVLRVMDKVRRGEEVPTNEISSAVTAITQAVEGKHVSRGFAAKLHDFADSLEGKSTRTWMGNDPRGGWPVANDVHAIRDLGYIDSGLIGRLLQPEEGGLFKRGFKREDFIKDSGDSPGVHQYERMREQYEQITRHLNAMDDGRGFDGRNDWTPSEVQALGWSGIQRLHGAVPEDLAYAAAANTRRVNLKVTKGISGIGNDLSVEETAAVAQAVEPAIRAIVEDTPGLWFDGQINAGVSAYEGGANASLHFDVLGSPEATQGLVDRLSNAFDQHDVWATRESSSTGAKPTLLIWHDALADPAKALALYKKLYAANPKKFAGFMQTSEEGVPAISLIMPGKAVTVASHDAALEELLPTISAAWDETMGSTLEANSRLANTQIIGKEWRSNVPSEKLRMERARSEGPVHDPLAAQARQHLEDAVRAVREGRAGGAAADLERGPPGATPGPIRNQSRRSDTLGATQLLNSATGERIIWLTENADFSTVMHELLGHAADEMKDLHPDEFAQVEQVIGKPLDEWSVADHEKFATWFERYLAEGHAPTPELVPVFDRAKQYMRVIYEQMRRLLGGRIPPATRNLFDHYLGGWDSESATRIAVDMGHYGPGEDIYSGAAVTARKELETLQKRNRTRRYNRSIPGMLDQLKKLERDAEKRGALNQEERDALASKIVRLRAEIVVRSDKRVRSLDAKIADMEKALTRDPENRRFSGALQAAKWLMDDRERILREAFGEEYAPLFENRRDLLANYLVQHGLLSPDFEHGTGSYFPMKLDEGFWQTMKDKVPMVPASNRVIGQVSKAMVGVHHKNEMIRWQAGDWSADPMVLHLAHARASSYQFVLELRELLHSMGRKLSFDEEHGHFPNGGYLVNLKGTPLSHDLRLQTRGMTHTTTADNLDDGLFGDDGKLEASLKSFFDNSVVDLENLPAGFDLADENLRFISKDAVNKIFRPVNLNVGGKVWDAGTTAARFALIYANAPGYMITNLAGNLVFLFGQQGLNWIPRTAAYAKMLANDRYLRERIQAEAGMVPALASITRGRGFQQQIGQAATRAEQAWLRGLSVVDEYPRMIAWLGEANKAGYYRKDDLIRLLDGKTPKTRRDRERVAEYANQHMIDFEHRVSDRERQTLGRLFFIWPYVRGATALPFWYGKNYPARTALIAQLALQQRAYQQSMLGPLPPGREDLYPLDVRGQQGVGAGRQATVIGSRYYNPTGPLADEARLASDLVASAFGRTPDNLTQRLSSLLNVNVEGLMTAFTGRDPFGRDVSLKKAVTGPYGIADSLIPFLRYVRAFNNKDYVPRAFREGEGDTWQERFYRNIIRIPPQTVSVDWLNAQAQSTGAKTTSQKIDLAVKANEKHFHSIEGARTHYPRALRKQVAAKVIYDDRVYAFEREQAAKAGFIPKQRDDGSWDFGYHADNYDKAMIAHAVLKQQFPEVLVEHPTFARSPNEYLADHNAPPRSVKGLDLVNIYNQFFNDMISKPPGEKGIMPAGAYDVRYAEKQTEKKYFKEKRQGAYAHH